MNYFVTVDGVEIASNLSKSSAMKRAANKHRSDPKLGGIQIGIGRIKMKRGKRVYTLIPYLYFNED